MSDLVERLRGLSQAKHDRHMEKVMDEKLDQTSGEIKAMAGELGKHMARFCDKAEPDARLKMPELLPRCHSCAFKAGNHLPNNQATTQMDALKCVMEGIPFYCHQKDRKGCLCSGWAMMMLAKSKPDFVVKVDWEFSDTPTKSGKENEG